MDCFEYERFFVKMSIRGYFERCLPFIPLKKKISRKSVKICELKRIHLNFTRIHLNLSEFT
jgi:hypothetical protein